MTPTGFAVAGGRSRRMGHDKALLPWGGTDLLGHTLDRLRAVTGDLAILSGPERRYEDRGVRIETDLLDNAGPLAGVLAGLDAAAGGPGLFLAVDLPLVPAALLAQLALLGADWDAVVPCSARGPEPLCAYYGAACLAPIRRCVASGDLRMTAFWPDVRVKLLDGAELEPFGDPETLFVNLNDPAAYARWCPPAAR